MNPDFLPALGRSLRSLAEFAAQYEMTDSVLAEIAAELERARSLVASARGNARANRCALHPGGPVDPAAGNGCLLCAARERRPAAPPPDDAAPGEVLRYVQAHGHQAAVDQYGGRAVARALSAGIRHPSNHRPGAPAGPGHHEDETEGAL